jgi:hypothetical protein
VEVVAVVVLTGWWQNRFEQDRTEGAVLQVTFPVVKLRWCMHNATERDVNYSNPTQGSEVFGKQIFSQRGL